MKHLLNRWQGSGRYHTSLRSHYFSKPLTCVTDYPLPLYDPKLTNAPHTGATVGWVKVRVLSYDGNKYCQVQYTNPELGVPIIYSVKSGYLKWSNDFRKSFNLQAKVKRDLKLPVAYGIL